MQKKTPVKKYIVFVWITGLLISGCKKAGNNNSGINPGDTSVTGLPPVESRAKVAPGQQPAFAGQNRVSGVRTLFNYHTSIITSGLNHPWGMVFLPDGRMMVSERSGTIRIVTSTGVVGNAIANVPAVRTGGEGGLLDLKLDPNFASTRLVFWTYIEPVGGTGVNCVASGHLSADETSFDNVTTIYRGNSPYSSSNHNGSRMIFDSNGLLYVSFGEGFDDVIRVKAQDLHSSLGKIIRINKDGTAAAGNPYAKTAGALPEIYSLGHRNPQGLAIDPQTHALWESEHGPQAGDEINLIQPGDNYGWPVIAYGLEYSGAVVGSGTQQTGKDQPVYYWDPAIAPSGMTFYTGTLIPEWHNNLFVASLKGMHIVRLIIANDRVIGEERLLADQNQRFRLVVEAPDGALYAITDMDQGRIYRISN
jgi:glucose/arabinose dehydrogenase